MTNMPRNPLIFIVPGAWHQPAALKTFVAWLGQAGLPSHVASYPSAIVSPNQPINITCADDKNALREQLLRVLDEGESRDVIVLAHSYGGIPGGGAAYGLSKPERVGDNKPNGVVGLIYISAFAIPEGVTGFGGSAADDPDGDALRARTMRANDPKEGLISIMNGIEYFYDDCDSAIAIELNDLLVPQAVSAFATIASQPAWAQDAFQGRRVYVRHLRDKAISLGKQDLMIKESGVEWETRDIDAAHSAWASKPDDLVGIIAEFALRWT